jgi:uncharacterized Fe-S cluster-containing protein
MRNFFKNIASCPSCKRNKFCSGRENELSYKNKTSITREGKIEKAKKIYILSNSMEKDMVKFSAQSDEIGRGS